MATLSQTGQYASAQREPDPIQLDEATAQVCLDFLKDLVPSLMDFVKLGFSIHIEFDQYPFGSEYNKPERKLDNPHSIPEGVPLIRASGHNRSYRAFILGDEVILAFRNSDRYEASFKEQQIKFPLSDPKFDIKKIAESIKDCERDVFKENIESATKSLEILAKL